MNKVQEGIKSRRHVRQLHTDYVEKYCRVCRNEGCYSSDLRNGTITIEEVVEERIKIYTYGQTDEEIRDDYNCYLE